MKTLLLFSGLVCCLGLVFIQPVLADNNSKETSWGMIKALYGDKEEKSQPGLAPGARTRVLWPFYDSRDNWQGWSGIRSDAWTHQNADYYSHDLSKAGCDGARIRAGMRGQVVQAVSPSEWNGGYGGTVVIYDWNRHVAIRYSHLSYVGVLLGRWVDIYSFIGKVGSTGLSTGSHLHITAYENIDHFSGGYPVIPNSHDSNYYACIIDFIF